MRIRPRRQDFGAAGRKQQDAQPQKERIVGGGITPITCFRYTLYTFGNSATVNGPGWAASTSQLLQFIKNHSLLLAPSRRIEATSDPDDNIFVECADAARADFLITGNRKHFPAFWKSTKMVTPREFVSLVAPHLIH